LQTQPELGFGSENADGIFAVAIDYCVVLVSSLGQRVKCLHSFDAAKQKVGGHSLVGVIEDDALPNDTTNFSPVR